MVTGCAQKIAPSQDPSKPKVQFVTVEEGVRMEVLDWGAARRRRRLTVRIRPIQDSDDSLRRSAVELTSPPMRWWKAARIWLTSRIRASGGLPEDVNQAGSMLCLPFIRPFVRSSANSFRRIALIDNSIRRAYDSTAFISEAERSSNSHSAINVAVIRPNGR